MFKLASAFIQDKPVETNFFDRLSDNYNYTKYLLNHKGYVADAGVQAGLSPLAILKHDWTKLKPENFSAYRDYIFGNGGIKGWNSSTIHNNFRRAADRHKKLEAHHFYRMSIPTDLNTHIESVVDWYSVGKSNAEMNGKFFVSFKTWWDKNKDKFLMRGAIDQETYDTIERNLNKHYNIFTYSIDQIKEALKGNV